jgi:hypothetical protein
MIRTYRKPVIQEMEKTEGNMTRKPGKKSTKPTQPAPKPDYIVLQARYSFKKKFSLLNYHPLFRELMLEIRISLYELLEVFLFKTLKILIARSR